MANVLLWHAGLTLVPDTDTSTWDGVTDCGDAVYQLEVAGKTMKFAVGVNENIPPITTKLNFRPGVMHFVYIKTDTTPGDCGIATDQPGLDGKKESLASSPSPSWVRPSGIPPDGAARTVHMKTIAKSSRGKSKSDKDYLKARGLPVNAMDQLFGLLLPDYTIASDPDWGKTLAHESGHVLGLAHRGNAWPRSRGVPLAHPTHRNCSHKHPRMRSSCRDKRRRKPTTLLTICSSKLPRHHGNTGSLNKP